MNKKIKYISLFSIFFIFLFSLIKPQVYAWGIDAGSIKVNYVDEDGNDLYIVDDGNGNKLNYVFQTGRTGTEFNIISPEYEGYLPDEESVTGTYAKNVDYETTVTYYKIKKYILTINCLDEYDNIIKTLSYEYDSGYEYDIDLDIIPGMTPNINKATGTLTENTTLNIKYTYKIRLIIIHFYDLNFRRLLCEEFLYFKGNGYLTIYPPLICGYYACKPLVVYIDKDTDIYISYTIYACQTCYEYYVI